ncbi:MULTISPECIES: DMT family transporter [unclassified Undibacterium]|uniref:DMT family transporter n=1 Tax=unclassified Undibacterium TaxID=2630295 RepID=UPI002AC8CB37|nr:MULTISPECIES: DMT family transporter [unclassified Undibacterium]MEB0137742.1 DMT family transporter [Undibacterium sp. CCC2.1]MEB0172816.1 DMT family transporter [Undibacterium sp. CCC1.1]MEB0176710.1 DMT family transporter [Undibacterium sp. CCC3.4]MEB0215964.1 DMT family transporter [Undibacterium sp. 5I2]WPX42317.1 DMT family transporter [Undibacterium sp. CCC3.4]
MTPQRKVQLATAFVIVCWAYSPIGIRSGLQAYAPGSLALLRFLIASLFMLGIALWRGIALPARRDIPLLLLLGAFAVSFHHLALNLGQRHVSVGAASILAQSTPIFSALIARFFLGEAVSRWRWGCIGVAMAGAALVALSDRSAAAPHYGYAALILGAAVSWSIYFSLQKRYGQRYSDLTMVCYTIWSGTLLLCAYLPGLAVQIAAAPLRVNMAVLLLGLFPSALAYLAWAYVLQHCQLSRAAAALYLVPPTAILMAAALWGELPSWPVLLGGALIIAALFGLQRGQQA